MTPTRRWTTIAVVAAVFAVAVYLNATSFATAASVITALVFWASWRRLEAEPA